MSDVLKNYLVAIKSVDSIDKLNQLLMMTLGNYGIEHFVGANIYGPVGTKGRTPLFGTLNHPWFLHYVGNRYHVDDIMVHAGPRATKPISWSKVIAEHELGSTQRKIICEAHDAGFEDGYLIPIKPSEDELAVVSLTGHNYIPRPDTEKELRLICWLAYKQSIKILAAHMVNPIKLTSSELLVAAWMAEDKSLGEVATILEMSENTVKTHMKNIKHKTETSTSHGTMSELFRFRLCQ